jgi:hypothetical protein
MFILCWTGFATPSVTFLPLKPAGLQIPVAGTTSVVASTHNRHYIGIELNQNYLKLAEERLSVCEPLLF